MRNFKPIERMLLPSRGFTYGFIPQVIEKNRITITPGVINNKVAENVNATLVLPNGDPIYVWVKCVFNQDTGTLESFRYESGTEVPELQNPQISVTTGYPTVLCISLFSAVVENENIISMVQLAIGSLWIVPVLQDISCSSFLRTYVVSYGAAI